MAYQAGSSCLCAPCLAAQLDAGVVVYGIANCDTVKKARIWLEEHGVAYAFWDYKKHGVPPAKLPHWMSMLTWPRMVNSRGTAWRGLSATQQASVVDDASAAAVLLATPSVIKRPIVTWGNTYSDALTVGFDPAAWQEIITICVP